MDKPTNANIPTPYESFDECKKWAWSRIHNGAEPPWSWYRLMQLVDAINAIIRSENATVIHGGITKEDSPESDQSPDVRPQSAQVHRIETTQRRPDEPEIDLPM